MWGIYERRRRGMEADILRVSLMVEAWTAGLGVISVYAQERPNLLVPLVGPNVFAFNKCSQAVGRDTVTKWTYHSEYGCKYREVHRSQVN